MIVLSDSLRAIPFPAVAPLMRPGFLVIKRISLLPVEWGEVHFNRKTHVGLHRMLLLTRRPWIIRALLACTLFAMHSFAGAQTFTADCSHWSGPPLVKTKFGVYQTPLIRLQDLLNTTPLLQEISVRDLRYEIGWGKPDVLAYDQISGTAARLQIDFAVLNAFTRLLAVQGVKPLFALTYCPNPLKSRQEWAAWKDLPNDLAAWQKMVQAYVAHLRNMPGMGGSCYEVWNEPDMPDPQGKMFFTGSPQDYGKLYAASVSGVRQGDRDALVGGAAIAYDLRYLTAILSQSLDFASIHAYDNYPAQVGNLRSALGDRPEVPLFLTEYASFTDLTANGPNSRSLAAARFFRDVKGMLTFPDLAKVYWAQWVDAGHNPGMGLLTWDRHRKAIFNAFKIYSMMPVDRNPVASEGGDGIDAFAASDDHTAGVVCWNVTPTPRHVTLRLQHLAFRSGTVKVYRIDPNHASYVDNPAQEDLHVCETRRFQKTSEVTWTGTLPAESVVFLKVSDATKQSLLSPASMGTYVRSHYWFFDRKSAAYSDFDPYTSIARLGMGDEDFDIAQISSVIEAPTNSFSVQAKKEGAFRAHDSNALFGLRIDFLSPKSGYSKSVLFHSGLFDAHRTSPFPWGKGAAMADVCVLKREMNTGKSFRVDLSRIAPPDWDRKRILISFILQNAGRGSKARIKLGGMANDGTAYKGTHLPQQIGGGVSENCLVVSPRSYPYFRAGVPARR